MPCYARWKPTMTVSNLTLPPDLADFVRGKMSTGEYTSEAQVVCEALAFLRERDEARALRLKELRAEIQIGLDQLDRGDARPFDADEIKAEVRRRWPVSPSLSHVRLAGRFGGRDAEEKVHQVAGTKRARTRE